MKKSSKLKNILGYFSSKKKIINLYQWSQASDKNNRWHTGLQEIISISVHSKPEMQKQINEMLNQEKSPSDFPVFAQKTAVLGKKKFNIKKSLYKFWDHNLKTQVDNSEFLRKEVLFLGHIVTKSSQTQF